MRDTGVAAILIKEAAVKMENTIPRMIVKV